MQTRTISNAFVANQHIVSEERGGYSAELMPRHHTELSDPDVYEEIRRLAFGEMVVT